MTDRKPTFGDILDLVLPMYRATLSAAPDPLHSAAAFGAALAEFVQTEVTPETPPDEVVARFLMSVRPRPPIGPN